MKAKQKQKDSRPSLRAEPSIIGGGSDAQLHADILTDEAEAAADMDAVDEAVQRGMPRDQAMALFVGH